ncbi:hypothetical protein GO613_12620 [Azoarcus communis]|uniref:hypothetical protein n=1 Tax=Parazoarcus communis TaxID=41977 RepID=UPI0014594D05|nr:hypothetical protein [Parazoarcus communis]NMG48944.1 hypothetical protein [Parazoarcus communis]
MSVYQSGVAANHVDLVRKLVTFLTADPDLVAAGQQWDILRYSGVASISASSFLVNWEPWKAFKGPYHDHDNGWSTAVGQQAPAWIEFELMTPRDLTRLSLRGSATTNQSPNTFELQWYDAVGEVWRTRQAWSGVTWSASETKSWTLDPWPMYDVEGVPTDLSGAKIRWRIAISANNGNTSSTVILRVTLPEWQVTADFNHGRMGAVWLRAPGMTGLDPVYVALQLYDRPTNDVYNVAITGATGFVNDADFDNQPGALTALGLPLWNQPIPYWFAANGQRFSLIAKVDTSYLTAYAGKILPFGTPLQYPYPLLIAAPLGSAAATRYSDASVNLPYKGNLSSMRLRGVNGTWIQPSAWPYSSGKSFRDTAGSYPLLPVTIYDSANTYGVLDGIHHVSGFSNVSENTVAVGTETHLVVQAVRSIGINDYFTMRIG